MRKLKKPVFFVVLFVIVFFAVLVFEGFAYHFGDNKTVYVKGTDDIRWGIDIRGGVSVTFTPAEDVDATDAQMEAVRELIVQRLINIGINDYECYVDADNDRLIVRFPWKSDDENFDPEAAVKEIGETAELTFREGYETDTYGNWTGVTESNVILTGSDVVSAEAMYNPEDGQYSVSLELSESGISKFSEATTRLVGKIISIWMDETCISYPTVNTPITNGEAQITGNFTSEDAVALAEKITAGALPFELKTDSFSTISPTLGESARNAMVLAGVIAFAVIAVFMIAMYRLPGVIAVISLLGQAAGCVAVVTGFFGFNSGSTLTIPGIAGIILSIGMGVDANVITAERIKEELRAGRSIDGAIQAGYSNAFSSVLDGNLTNVIVAIVLMGAFGAPSTFWTTIFKPFFFMFATTTEGTIFSFGFNLLVGVIFNFIMSIFASHVMLSSITKFKGLRKLSLFGVKKESIDDKIGGGLNE